MDDEVNSKLSLPLIVILFLFVSVACNGCACFHPRPVDMAQDAPRGGIKISDDTAGIIGAAGELLKIAGPAIPAR
jgi:hypothetical protein